MDENVKAEKNKNAPRLYLGGAALGPGAEVGLGENQAHYLFHVLRREAGSDLRVFDGVSGEWRAELLRVGKKGAAARCVQLLRPQPPAAPGPVLLLSPLKKEPFDWALEKATELGAARIVPVLCARTVARKVNEDRARAILTEAAEQCERLDVPVLDVLEDLSQVVAAWAPSRLLFFCHERAEAAPLSTAIEGVQSDYGLLVGPEGGFTPEEAAFLLKHPFVKPVSLGPRILRAETAALAALAICALR